MHGSADEVTAIENTSRVKVTLKRANSAFKFLQFSFMAAARRDIIISSGMLRPTAIYLIEL